MTKRLSQQREQRPGDLIPGTLEVLILKAVSRAGKMHGYAIAEWIHAVSEETLRVEEGALYPALHRLELRGLLEPEWGLSGTNRRVKFYRLTAAGRRCLADERKYWGRMTAGVMRVLEST